MAPTGACSWHQSGRQSGKRQCVGYIVRTNNHDISADTPSSYLLPNSHQIDPIGYGLGDTTLAICTNKPLMMQDPTSGITWDHHAAPY